MLKVILSLALCLLSVRAQTGRGLAKDNLSSGGRDWSQRRRLAGPVDDVCDGGGPSHRFESRLECCEHLDANDLDTFCTGSCPPSGGCTDMSGPHLGGVVELRGANSCARVGSGDRYSVMEGPMDVEVYAPGSGNSGGIQNIEVYPGAQDATISVTGHIRESIRAMTTGTGTTDNLFVDVTGTGTINHDVQLRGANSKLLIQPGGSVGAQIYMHGTDNEVDVKGHAAQHIEVKGVNARLHIHAGATIGPGYLMTVHVHGNGAANNFEFINNGPRTVTMKRVGGMVYGVTCNGAAVTFSGNPAVYDCPSV